MAEDPDADGGSSGADMEDGETRPVKMTSEKTAMKIQLQMKAYETKVFVLR